MSRFVDYDGRICKVIAHNRPVNGPDTMQCDESYDLKDVRTARVYQNVPRWLIVNATETQMRIYMDQRLS